MNSSVNVDYVRIRACKNSLNGYYHFNKIPRSIRGPASRKVGELNNIRHRINRHTPKDEK
jgi:hypothetical protein